MVNVRPILDAKGNKIATIWVTNRNGMLTLERSTFINEFSRVISVPESVQVEQAAAIGDWAALDSFDPELMPWYCRTCKCNFAEKAWHTWPKFDEDDPAWLDSYRGRCPNGHERMIAD